MREHLEKLTRPVRDAMETALALTKDEERRQAVPHFNAALAGVDWPCQPAVVPLITELTDEQHAVAMLLAEHRGAWFSARWAMPRTRWNRRRWLGLDPPSSLESEHEHEGTTAPLWQHVVRCADDPDAMVTLLRNVPLRGRLEALVDLNFDAYHCPLRRADDIVPGALDDPDLGPAVASWAPQLANRLLERYRTYTRDRGYAGGLQAWVRFVAFLPLARAGVPIERQWEELLPLGSGEPWSAWMHECVGALPVKRRTAALTVAFRRELDDEAILNRAMDLFPQHPTAWLTKQILRRSRRHTRRSEGELLAEMRTLTAGAEDLRKLVDAHAAKRKPVRLSVKRIWRPERPEDVPDHLQHLVEHVGTVEELFDADAALAILHMKEARSRRSYTVFIHHVDTGVVFRGHSTEVVAEVIQFSFECEDEALEDGLRTALRSVRQRMR